MSSRLYGLLALGHPQRPLTPDPQRWSSPVQKLLVGKDLLQPAGVLELEGEHSRGGVGGEHLDDARGEGQGHLACDLHDAPVEHGRVSATTLSRSRQGHI